MAFLQRDAINDYLSPGLLASKSIAFGKKESLGRHVASARATRTTDQRAPAELFFVSRSSGLQPPYFLIFGNQRRSQKLRATENRINPRPRCQRDGERSDNSTHLAARDFNPAIQHSHACLAQEGKRACSNQCRQNRRSADTSILDRT